METKQIMYAALEEIKESMTVTVNNNETVKISKSKTSLIYMKLCTDRI